MDPGATSSIPLKIGADSDFALARQFFRENGFGQRQICPPLGMEDMSDLGKVQWEKLDPKKFSPALWACLQVFLRGNSLPEADLAKAWGTPVLNAFRALGLIRDSRHTPGQLICPVWLYPVEDFFIASDRGTDPEAETPGQAEDVVFPGIYLGTLRFLRLFPEARGGEALDLCGGSGIGALQLARTARKAVTADLTPRSAYFAEFNGRLSGVPIESLCGDLYAPVKGRQFDVVTAHPPFVPSRGKTMIYRDAGATGEDVTRGVISHLSDHLRPGGTCMVLCVACDTFEAPLEKRIWDWLGERHREFDVLYGLEKVLTVEEVVASMIRRGQNVEAGEAQNLMDRLRSAGTRQFVYGAIFIRRLHTPSALSPLRFRIDPSATAAEFERLFAWREWCARPHLNERLAEVRPTPRRELQLNIRHVVASGELVPAEFVFSVESGIRAGMRPDGWVVPLLAQFNGTRSVKEVFTRFQSEGELPEGFDQNAFAGLVKQMIEKGFYEIEMR